MSWQLKGTPNPLTGQENNSKAGESVAVSQDGTVVVQGCPGSKKVLIYKYNGTTWGTPYVLTAVTNRYGVSVSLSNDGTVLLVGASPQSGIGAVYLYKYNGSEWLLLTKIDCPDADAGRLFGESVFLRTTSTMYYIAVGAPTSNFTANYGSAYTFTYNIDSSTLNQRMPVLHTSYDEYPIDRFGSSVAMSNDFNTLVVGAPITTNGSAYVYSWNGETNLWNTTPEQILTGDNTGDYFGKSVSISEDGTKVVVGAPYATVNGISSAGYVYVYNSATWTVYSLTNNKGIIANDSMGSSVCMDAGGITFVAGSFLNAVVFSFNSTTETWTSVKIDNPNASLVSDAFGYSVALAAPDSGNTFVIGAPYSGNGKSYVFYYSSTPPLCLTEGTRVLTPAGYRPVEQLEKFDYVSTSDGRNVMIKHIHHSQHYNVGEQEAPFHVPAHAIAENVPSHDVKLSPDHLIHIGDDLWLTPRGMAKRSDNVVQYDIGKNIHYYAIMTPNYFQDNLVIEDGVVVEAYGARDIVYDEEKKAYFRKAKEDK